LSADCGFGTPPSPFGPWQLISKKCSCAADPALRGGTAGSGHSRRFDLDQQVREGET
jgi:hypothetical protein